MVGGMRWRVEVGQLLQWMGSMTSLGIRSCVRGFDSLFQGHAIGHLPLVGRLILPPFVMISKGMRFRQQVVSPLKCLVKGSWSNRMWNNFCRRPL